MTTISYLPAPEVNASGPGVITHSYRDCPTEHQNASKKFSFPTPPSSSSSSSAPSGATTPVDELPPTLVSFPRQPTFSNTSGLSSSGSSQWSIEAQKRPSFTPLIFPTSRSTKSGTRVRTDSESTPSALVRPRPPKLSLDTTKVKPLVPSASVEASPLGAFSPTSSATRHLRHLVDLTNAQSISPRSRTLSHTVSNTTPDGAGYPASASRRDRGFRTLSFSWSKPSNYYGDDVDDNSSDNNYNSNDTDSRDADHQQLDWFWPHRRQTSSNNKNKGAHQNVPSITRSASPPEDGHEAQPQPSAGAPTLTQRHTSPVLPSQARASAADKPHTTRSTSYSGSGHARSVSLPMVAGTTASVSGYRDSLCPPPRVAKAGKLARRPTLPSSPRTRSPLPDYGLGRSPSSATGLKDEKPGPLVVPAALAAVEKASRLRINCVCAVCGKSGKDFPRCPRCSMTWCSRECRVSQAGPGARHQCGGPRAVVRCAA